MMYMPIWILYLFPHFLLINFFVKLILSSIGVFVSGKCIHTKNTFSYSSLKCCFFSVIAEIMGVGLFFVFESNLPSDFYYQHYTVFSAIAFITAISLTFVLNYFFLLDKKEFSKKQRIVASVPIVLLSAPYLFLLPHGSVF